MLNPEILAAEPNPNHPKLGDTIKVEPIRTVNAINKIKKALAPSPSQTMEASDNAMRQLSSCAPGRFVSPK